MSGARPAAGHRPERSPSTTQAGWRHAGGGADWQVGATGGKRLTERQVRSTQTGVVGFRTRGTSRVSPAVAVGGKPVQRLGSPCQGGMPARSMGYRGSHSCVRPRAEPRGGVVARSPPFV